MREILFRGKDPATQEWIYGDLKHINGRSVIHIDCGPEYIVCPETVGQYTGLNDKNGQRIFEGDILKFDWARGEQYIGEVVWDSEYACFDIKPHAENIDAFFGIMNCDEFEVIGNIYDNPELLEVAP